MRRAARSVDDGGEIDITPMLDVVFIMLIFFIVTTSFVRETGLDPVRPEAVNALHEKRASILVAVSASGEVWMQKKPVALAQVRLLAERLVAEAPDSTAIVIADRGAPTGVVLDVMEQVRLAKVRRIAVGADPAR